MKLSLGAATFVATTLLMGGGVAYSLVADEPTDDVVVTEPTTDEPTTDLPEVEEPEGVDVDGDVEGEEPEGGEPEGDDVEGDEKPGGAEAAAEHREAMAAWKDCVDAAVEAAGATEEPVTEEPVTEEPVTEEPVTDVLTLCGTKPAPPGKALGWDGEKVSKSAQKKVDKAADRASGDHGKPEKEPKAEKAPKAKKGKGHQR
ncbi:MAG TPA: hypothetical protein VFK41_07175 [Nocardioidaceae bacterium]|nr:hypothetical protein [Nocardioidaceae bacterium]